MENKWTLHPNQLETVEKDLLYTALANAQAEFPHIETNRNAHRNRYADLYGIFHKIYPILRIHGLAIRPWAEIREGEQWIGARLAHDSGQYETNAFKFEMDPVKGPADQISHKKQATITYFNRNHMKDMLGILLTDDPQDDDYQSHMVEPVKIQAVASEKSVKTQAVASQLSSNIISRDQFIQINRLIGNDKNLEESFINGFRNEGILSIDQELDSLPQEAFEACIKRLQDIRDRKFLLKSK